MAHFQMNCASRHAEKIQSIPFLKVVDLFDAKSSKMPRPVG